MSKSRDAVIAVTATIFFGVFSRVTVRIPYMVWGYFDESFFISFVWWLLYAGSLYVAIREYMENVDGYFKVILQAGLFGGAAALIKTIRHITIPSLIPTYFVLLMINIANFLNNGLDQYFVFSNAFNMEYIHGFLSRLTRSPYPSGQFLELFRILCDNVCHSLFPFYKSFTQYLLNIRFPIEEFPAYV